MQKTFTVITNRADHSGGMERYAIDIVHYLNKSGRLVTLLAKHFPKPSNIDKAISVKSLAIRWLPSKLQTLLFSGYCWFYKKRHPQEILFSCSRILFPDIMACGGTHKGYLRDLNKTPTLRDRVEIFFESQAYQNAIIIVAHSIAMQKELIEDYLIAKDKIITLYPPVKRTNFYISKNLKNKNDYFKRINVNIEEKVVFLFPSSGHQRKGLNNIISAIMHFKQQAILLIAGKRSTHCQENIISLGYVTDMPTLYSACDYTILASRHEPFGLVAIESVLCGTPVILSNQCGCNAVLANQIKMNFEAGNIDELTSVIEMAIKNPIHIHEPEKFIDYDLDVQYHFEMIKNFFNTKNINLQY